MEFSDISKKSRKELIEIIGYASTPPARKNTLAED